MLKIFAGEYGWETKRKKKKTNLQRMDDLYRLEEKQQKQNKVKDVRVQKHVRLKKKKQQKQNKVKFGKLNFF